MRCIIWVQKSGNADHTLLWLVVKLGPQTRTTTGRTLPAMTCEASVCVIAGEHLCPLHELNISCAGLLVDIPCLDKYHLTLTASLKAFNFFCRSNGMWNCTCSRDIGTERAQYCGINVWTSFLSGGLDESRWCAKYLLCVLLLMIKQWRQASQFCNSPAMLSFWHCSRWSSSCISLYICIYTASLPYSLNYAKMH